MLLFVYVLSISVGDCSVCQEVYPMGRCSTRLVNVANRSRFRLVKARLLKV